MAAGEEYLTSHRHIAYPFKEDASGILAGVIPKGLFVDMVLISGAEHEQVYLSAIVYSAGVFTMALVDQTGAVVQITQTTWVPGGYYTELALTPYSSAVCDPTLRVVVHTDTMTEYLADYTVPVSFGTTLPLESSIFVPRPLRIDSLDLYTSETGLPDPPEPEVPGPITGQVRLKSGYNIDQFIESPVVPLGELEEVFDTVAINLEVSPGGGEGAYPCPEPEFPPVGASDARARMRLNPDDDGNVNIEVGEDQCYEVIPMPETGQIQIQGTCEACCTCEDYDNVGHTLECLLRRVRHLLDRFNAQHEEYETGVTIFNEKVSPLYHEVILKLNGAVGPRAAGDNLRSHSMNWANIVATLRNNSPYPIQPYSYELTVSSPDSAIVRHIGWEYDSVGGQLPPAMAGELMGEVPTVRVGKALDFEFRMYMDYASAKVAPPTWNATLKILAYVMGPNADTVELNSGVSFS
jgi:hypothetical protein